MYGPHSCRDEGLRNIGLEGTLARRDVVLEEPNPPEGAPSKGDWSWKIAKLLTKTFRVRASTHPTRLPGPPPVAATGSRGSSFRVFHAPLFTFHSASVAPARVEPHRLGKLRSSRLGRGLGPPLAVTPRTAHGRKGPASPQNPDPIGGPGSPPARRQGP